MNLTAMHTRKDPDFSKHQELGFTHGNAMSDFSYYPFPKYGAALVMLCLVLCAIERAHAHSVLYTHTKSHLAALCPTDMLLCTCSMLAKPTKPSQ